MLHFNDYSPFPLRSAFFFFFFPFFLFSFFPFYTFPLFFFQLIILFTLTHSALLIFSHAQLAFKIYHCCSQQDKRDIEKESSLMGACQWEAGRYRTECDRGKRKRSRVLKPVLFWSMINCNECGCACK